MIYLNKKNPNNPKKKNHKTQNIVLCKGTVQAKGLCSKIVMKRSWVEVTYLTHLWYFGSRELFHHPKKVTNWITWNVVIIIHLEGLFLLKSPPTKGNHFMEKRHRLRGLKVKKKELQGGVSGFSLQDQPGSSYKMEFSGATSPSIWTLTWDWPCYNGIKHTVDGRTWDVKSPVYNGIFTISTSSPDSFHQQ